MQHAGIWERVNGTVVSGILHLLATEKTCDEVTVQKVSYTLQVLLSESEKFILLWLLFLSLNRLEEFLIVFVSLCSLRVYVGGTHRKSMLGCFLFSCLSFGIILFAAEMIRLPVLVRIVIYLSMILWIWVCAPIPSPGRICYNREQRLVFKGKALSVLVILCVIGRGVPDRIENLMAWAAAFQSLESGWVVIHMNYSRKE